MPKHAVYTNLIAALVQLIFPGKRLTHYTITSDTIEGFHVMSYQANFASHHTHDRHVGFPLAWQAIGKHNKMSR